MILLALFLLPVSFAVLVSFLFLFINSLRSFWTLSPEVPYAA